MAISGRKLRVYRNTVAVVGARADNITISNEPIDATDKDDAGWRTLIDVGARSFSAEVEGVLKDDTLIAEAAGTGTLLIKECVVDIDGIATLTGDFMLASIQLAGEQADVTTFTATMESSGAITGTIAPYNITAPAITGTVSDGQTLTTTNGTWGGDATISFARQWQKFTGGFWTDIATETGLTYTLVTADVGALIRCRVIATNTEGSTTAYSNIVGPVAA